MRNNSFQEDIQLVFSSLFFLCVFLPVSLALYYAIKNRTYRNWVLIITSLFFYAWGEPVWVSLLIISTLFDYYCALIIEKNRGNWRSRAALITAVTANLSILGYFKYAGFLMENVNNLLGTSFNIMTFSLPIGISFYTFQTISYVVDVYRGDVEAQRSPFKLLLYVSMFHQLVAGPIVRYKDIAEAIDNRVETVEDFNYGVGRFIVGLGKKVLLANTAGSVASMIMGNDYSRLPVSGAWFGIILFSFQIYFDFSGYSDMAIGMGRMFGFKYRENFDHPYISKSATEFWRRWHMSLGSFFRDYVYIPLGGNKKHVIRNLFIVWSLTGLWHGASWNFVVWGIYYFVLLFIEKQFLLKFFEKIPAIFSCIYLWLAVIVGWVFFYHTDINQALRYIGVMFGKNAASLNSPEISIIFLNNLPFLIISCIACTPLAMLMNNKINELSGGSGLFEKLAKPAINICILLLCILFLVGQSYNPFLYFRF